MPILNPKPSKCPSCQCDGGSSKNPRQGLLRPKTPMQFLNRYRSLSPQQSCCCRHHRCVLRLFWGLQTPGRSGELQVHQQSAIPIWRGHLFLRGCGHDFTCRGQHEAQGEVSIDACVCHDHHHCYLCLLWRGRCLALLPFPIASVDPAPVTTPPLSPSLPMQFNIQCLCMLPNKIRSEAHLVHLASSWVWQPLGDPGHRKPVPVIVVTHAPSGCVLTVRVLKSICDSHLFDHQCCAGVGWICSFWRGDSGHHHSEPAARLDHHCGQAGTVLGSAVHLPSYDGPSL